MSDDEVDELLKAVDTSSSDAVDSSSGEVNYTGMFECLFGGDICFRLANCSNRTRPGYSGEMRR